MKLTSAQVERTMTQFDARPVPDDHPMVPQLNNLFGDHTFFLDRNGLSVVEPAETQSRASRLATSPTWRTGPTRLTRGSRRMSRSRRTS